MQYSIILKKNIYTIELKQLDTRLNQKPIKINGLTKHHKPKPCVDLVQ